MGFQPRLHPECDEQNLAKSSSDQKSSCKLDLSTVSFLSWRLRSKSLKFQSVLRNPGFKPCWFGSRAGSTSLWSISLVLLSVCFQFRCSKRVWELFEVHSQPGQMKMLYCVCTVINISVQGKKKDDFLLHEIASSSRTLEMPTKAVLYFGHDCMRKRESKNIKVPNFRTRHKLKKNEYFIPYDISSDIKTKIMTMASLPSNVSSPPLCLELSANSLRVHKKM